LVRRREVPRRKWPQVGDHVIVPFGGYGAVGEVTRVSGWRTVWVTVEFKVDPEAEEPTLMTYEVDEIQPAEAA